MMAAKSSARLHVQLKAHGTLQNTALPILPALATCTSLHHITSIDPRMLLRRGEMLHPFVWQDVGHGRSAPCTEDQRGVSLSSNARRAAQPLLRQIHVVRVEMHRPKWYIYISLVHTRQISRQGNPVANVALWAVARGSGLDGLRDLHGLHLGDKHRRWVDGLDHGCLWRHHNDAPRGARGAAQETAARADGEEEQKEK